MPPTSLAQPIPASATFAPSLLSIRQRSVRRRSEMITCFRLAAGAVMPRDTAIAAEVPVALVYNGVSHVVMMATPSDLADFAVGFSVSEGILRDHTELLDLEIEEGKTGIRVSMTITEERFAGLKARRRNMTGRTGCGLCGVDDLTQVARPLPRAGPGVTVAVGAVHRTHARRVGAVGQHHCLRKSRADQRVGNGALGLERRCCWSGLPGASHDGCRILSERSPHAASACRSRDAGLATVCSASRRVRSCAIASWIASSKSWSRKGLVRNSIAPPFMARTDIGTSACPLMKMIGRRNFAFANSS